MNQEFNISDETDFDRGNNEARDVHLNMSLGNHSRITLSQWKSSTIVNLSLTYEQVRELKKEIDRYLLEKD